MTDIQHADDIEIPDIEIAPGWPVSDVATMDDCDDAFAYLMSAVASIEYQLDIAVDPDHPRHGDRYWRAKANASLKFKKAALQIVNQKRSRINRDMNVAFQRERDRVLLAFIKSKVPAEQFMRWVDESGVRDMSVDEAA